MAIGGVPVQSMSMTCNASFVCRKFCAARQSESYNRHELSMHAQLVAIFRHTHKWGAKHYLV
jgi:hypothetical protein